MAYPFGLRFNTEELFVPAVDVDPFMTEWAACEGVVERLTPEVRLQCTIIREAMEALCAVKVRSSKVTNAAASMFLNHPLRCFDRPAWMRERDSDPTIGFQAGLMPGCKEIARHYPEIVQIPEEFRPEVADGDPTKADFLKERYFHRVNECGIANRPPYEHGTTNRFSSWLASMQSWGEKVTSVGEVLLIMLAIAYELPPYTFTAMVQDGPHLVSPTGVNLIGVNPMTGVRPVPGDTLAYVHRDLNFLSGHGKGTHSGLVGWTSDGKAFLIKVGDGELLFQAAMQLEALTGGQIKAGFHGVYMLDSVYDAINQLLLRDGEPRERIIRTTSTVFITARYEAMMGTLPYFQELTGSWDQEKYPNIPAREQMLRELKGNNMAAEATGGLPS